MCFLFQNNQLNKKVNLQIYRILSMRQFLFTLLACVTYQLVLTFDLKIKFEFNPKPPLKVLEFESAVIYEQLLKLQQSKIESHQSQGRCTLQNCSHCYLNQTCIECHRNYTLYKVQNRCLELNYQESPISNQRNLQDSSSENIQAINQTYFQQNDTNFQISPSINNASSESDQNEDYLFKSISQKFGGFKIHSKFITKTFTFINCTPLLRIFLPFLSPLFFFFDDYWYYIYHNNAYENLEVVQNLLIFMYVVNSQRIIPSFLQFKNPLQPTSFTTSNYTLYTDKQILLIDQKPTFLIQNINDAVFQQFVVLAVFFIIAKLLNIGIHRVVRTYFGQNYSANENSIKQSLLFTGLRKFYEHMEVKLSFKNILMTFIGSNLIFFSFYFSVQLKMLFKLNPYDNLNMVVTIGVGFVLIAFTILIIIYFQFFVLDKRLTLSQIKGVKQCYQSYMEQKKEDYTLTLLIHFKCIGYGLVHGFFLTINTHQYIFLIVIKVILITNLIINRKLLSKDIYFHLSFTYFLLGIGLDTFILVSKHKMLSEFFLSQFFDDITYLRATQFILIILACFSIFFYVVADIYIEIKSTFFQNRSKLSSDQTKIVPAFSHKFNKVFPLNVMKKESVNRIEFKISIKQTRPKIVQKAKTKEKQGTILVSLNFQQNKIKSDLVIECEIESDKPAIKQNRNKKIISRRVLKIRMQKAAKLLVQK